MFPRPGLTRAVLRAAVLGFLATLAACGPAAPAQDDGAEPIRFASYDFQENQILVEVYAEGVRRAGLPVSVQHGIGTREVVAPALEQGVVDVVVEYLGTALVFNRPAGSALPGTPEEMAELLEETMEERDVEVLEAARAEDQNGFAVSAAFVAQHGIRRLSDLAPLAPGLTFGGPPECPERPLCLPGLEKTYELRFGEVRAMSSRAATVEALMAGDIDVGLLETTEARLVGAPLVLLVDDRGLQPPENVVPLVREDVADRWGDRLTDALDDTSARLTTLDVLELNRSVEIDGRTLEEAAAQWWRDNG